MPGHEDEKHAEDTKWESKWDSKVHIGHGEGHYKLVPRITIGENTGEIFCVRFSPDGKFLAVGCGDGAIRVFNTATGSMSYNLQGGSNVALPTTAIKFRPITPSTKTKNVLIAANAAGTVQHWHMTSAKCLHSAPDDHNQVYALDYNEEGTQYVTAGKDTAVRLYDEATKTLLSTMQGSGTYSVHGPAGHSNRIFSCKFVPFDQNVVITGGWDNTLQLWDIRTGFAVRSIFGPHICGDSLDVNQNEILTGSWRHDNQLEIFDYGSGEKITDIPWHSSNFNAAGQPACMLYAAQFSKEKGKAKFIAAGGSGANEAKVFDHMNNNQVIGTVTGLNRGIFTLDFSPEESKVAIAGADATIRILDIVPSN